MVKKVLIAKFRLKLKKVGKTTRPFWYDLNVFLSLSQIILLSISYVSDFWFHIFYIFSLKMWSTACEYFCFLRYVFRVLWWEIHLFHF